jgi:hypothetical protein
MKPASTADPTELYTDPLNKGAIVSPSTNTAKTQVKV